AVPLLLLSTACAASSTAVETKPVTIPEGSLAAEGSTASEAPDDDDGTAEDGAAVVDEATEAPRLLGAFGTEHGLSSIDSEAREGVAIGEHDDDDALILSALVGGGTGQATVGIGRIGAIGADGGPGATRTGSRFG